MIFIKKQKQYWLNYFRFKINSLIKSFDYFGLVCFFMKNTLIIFSLIHSHKRFRWTFGFLAGCSLYAFLWSLSACSQYFHHISINSDEHYGFPTIIPLHIDLMDSILSLNHAFEYFWTLLQMLFHLSINKSLFHSINHCRKCLNMNLVLYS